MQIAGPLLGPVGGPGGAASVALNLPTLPLRSGRAVYSSGCREVEVGLLGCVRLSKEPAGLLGREKRVGSNCINVTVGGGNCCVIRCVGGNRGCNCGLVAEPSSVGEAVGELRGLVGGVSPMY